MSKSFYLKVHQDVLDALDEEICQRSLDIKRSQLLLFLMSYGYSLGPYLMLEGAEMIRWLDVSYSVIDGDNGRIKERLYTDSEILLQLSDEDRYLYLLTAMYELNLGLDQLELGSYSY